MSERDSTPGLAGRTARQLRSKLHTDVHEKLDEQKVSLSDLEQGLVALQDQIAHLHARLDSVETDARRAAEIGRHAYDEEPANRRRLKELRRSEEYELAFTETEPLVSFIVPTYDSFETLRDVALPSILGQNYSNVEVIVSGDCAPPETEQAIAEVGDPRVTYINRTIRGPYPEEPSRRWYGIGVPPVNDALGLVRGRWIAALGDDDAIRPNHTSDLLAAAKENRWEHCYGLQEVNFVEGDPITLGKFPPALGQWGPQAALYLAGLRFIEGELSDAIYEEPSDWSKCRRQVRAGVRFGMIDKVVVDKNETRRRSAREWEEGRVPGVG
jgi:Glycosyl transferase family 2